MSTLESFYNSRILPPHHIMSIRTGEKFRNSPGIDADGFKEVRSSKTVRENPRSVIQNLPLRGHQMQSNCSVAKKPHYKEDCLPLAERNLMRVQTQSCSKHTKGSFKVGTIICAPLHEQDFNGRTKVVDQSITDSVYGRIHTKFRKMIIVSVFDQHYVVVPCYSHGGQGLDNKHAKEEFMSIQDHRSREKVTAQSGRPVLVTQQINSGIEPYHPKTVVHLARPYSRSYDTPCIMEGRIAKISITELTKAYRDSIAVV